MIEVAAGQALIDGMSGVTAGMAGQSMADAYNQRMTETYEDASGLSIGVGNWTSDSPAISGNTGGTVVSSTDSDPVEAWDNYTKDVDDNVSDVTGGAVSGSSVQTFNYSILKNTDEDLQAVSPVSVPADRAVVAICQALGVSMNYMSVDQKTKTALLAAVGLSAYETASGLVTAWWDGVNILFPRKTVQNVADIIASEGIGGDQVSILPDYSSLQYPDGYPNGIGHNSSELVWVQSIYRTVILRCAGGQFCGFYDTSETAIPYSTSPNAVYTLSRVTSSGEVVESTKRLYSSVTTRISGTTVYYGEEIGVSQGTIDGSYPKITAGSTNFTDIFTILVDGIVSGGDYPSGTSQSLAPSYTPSSIPSAGGIATSPTTTTDVVAISLDDGLDSSQSTEDPNRGTVQKEVTDLPAPPLPVPVPDTNVSNPDVPIVSNPSIVDTSAIDSAIDALADSLRANAPQSVGIIPFPAMPGGSGEGAGYPSIVPASGSGLIHVYNPTSAEMVSFGNWLWVTYADATIEKIWNNPFDGIIGAFELYCTPSIDGRDNIRSGFLTCPTTANLVRQRYVEIDCGTVVIPEFYGNYLDYSPYSQCYIYLPFIGINEVSVDDIVGHAVNIRYRVDCYNGSCIAMIYVAKANYRNLCYQFAGNCAVELPLAGGSQAAIKAGVLQAEAYSRASLISAGVSGINSIGQGAARGALIGGGLGAIAGGLGGFATAVAGNISAYQNSQAGIEAARVANKSSVQHSGQFGASHGAMGLKKPFVMIRNPIQVKVINYNDDYGYPAHKRVVIGGCTGYLRVREVNVISAHATDAEKAAIESALKGGVYVS